MPALIAGAASSSDGHARVVTTSSSGAYLDTLHYDTLREKITPSKADADVETSADAKKREKAARKARAKLGTYGLYYQSKFGNAVVARMVAQRYADQGVLSYSCNPGACLMCGLNAPSFAVSPASKLLCAAM